MKVNVTCSHSYRGGEVTKQPTTTSERTMTYTCRCCGEKKTERIQKLEKETETEPETRYEPETEEEPETRYEPETEEETECEPLPKVESGRDSISDHIPDGEPGKEAPPDDPEKPMSAEEPAYTGDDWREFEDE